MSSPSHDPRHTEPRPATTAPRLRVLHVTPRFAPYVGGTEIHTQAIGTELAARGHAVTVLTTDATGSLPKRERIDGIDVRRVRAFPKGTDLYLAPSINKVIGLGDWDLVHVQGFHTAVAPMALRAASRAGIPSVLTFHSGGHASSARNMLRPAHVRAIRKYVLSADRMIGVSVFEADLFAKRLGIEASRIDVIPNGVSNSKAPTAVVHSVTDGEGPMVISVGRLVRYKGHQRVLRALPFLIEDDPRTQLLIIGRGPYEQRLRQIADDLGVADHVTIEFVPGDQRERLHEYMHRASLAMLLSDYESHGMAAHEALDAGLPLVVVNRTALGELATSGLAAAVPPNATPREVAEIALRTMADPDAAMSGQRPNVPSWSEITDRIEDVYASLVPDVGVQPGS